MLDIVAVILLDTAIVAAVVLLDTAIVAAVILLDASIVTAIVLLHNPIVTAVLLLDALPILFTPALLVNVVIIQDFRVPTTAPTMSAFLSPHEERQRLRPATLPPPLQRLGRQKCVHHNLPRVDGQVRVVE